jgi:hypothetical protein
MTVTADALDLLAGDPPRYPHVEGDFRRHPETGAPYVNHPTDTTKDGRPRRVMYGRPSSFGSALDNPFNLVKWKERQLLIGAWKLNSDYDDLLVYVDPDDRDALDGLAARCHEAAGSHLAADRGTHIHLLLELDDRGEDVGGCYAYGETLGIPPALQDQIAVQWVAFRKRLGLTALAVEQTVVNDRWRLAGTLDRLDVSDRDHLTAFGVLEAGVPFVGDLKTGSLTVGNDGQPNWWTKYSVQIAAYVDAVPYDTNCDARGTWDPPGDPGPPNPDIALIYHYDLARALAGEVVDWQAIPVNVQAGREGGDLCRAAADFAKRRDLFAMPAPSTTTLTENVDRVSLPSGSLVDQVADAGANGEQSPAASPTDFAAPVGPNPTVEQRTADPEPSTASTAVPGRAADDKNEEPCSDTTSTLTSETACTTDSNSSSVSSKTANASTSTSSPPTNSTTSSSTPANRDRLRARVAELVACGNDPELRRYWPEGVPTLKHDGHSDAQLQLILAAVRRVEAEVGAGWHPDDSAEPRSRQAIARALNAWKGRDQGAAWFAASLIATFEQCRNADATLEQLVAQFSIEQADKFHDAAHRV